MTLRPFRVYASDQAHSSVEKAMIVLGLGEENVVRVRSDESIPHGCARARARDRGATSQAAFARWPSWRRWARRRRRASTLWRRSLTCVRAHDVWLHVDAAYGGALAMLPERRDVMAGAERADSVVVNGHKWLFVPLDFSALYTRRPEVLRSVFALTPEYLARRCGRRRAASTIWTTEFSSVVAFARSRRGWRCDRSGAKGWRREFASIAGSLSFSQVGWSSDPYYSIAAPVTMAVVCFRFDPPGVSEVERDELNERIVEAVNAGGDAYLTHTTLRGRRVMRIGVGNVLTDGAAPRARRGGEFATRARGYPVRER